MICRFAFALSFFLATFLQAGVQDYFKPALNKTGYHQIPNIDYIYIINLDERPEKLNNCLSQLEPFGIYPYRFSAVNGWKLPLSAFNELGVKWESWMAIPNLWGTSYFPDGNGEPHHEIMSVVGRTYFCHCTARGTVGISLSHLSVLQDAYDSGYETIWVMEDDIHVQKDPNILSSLIKKLDDTVGHQSWDILFTDPDIKDLKGNYVPCTSHAPRPNFRPSNPGRFAVNMNIGKDFKRIGNRFGAHSMIVRRSGMKKILDFIKTYNLFLPYDMDYTMPNDIKCYSLRYDVVSNFPGAISDNGGANYEK